MKFSKTLSLISLLGAISTLAACSNGGLGMNMDKPAEMPSVSMPNTSGLIENANSLLANPLVKQLSSGLGLGGAQTVGGTGALLALANQTLSPKLNDELLQYIPDVSQFTSMIPGVDSNNITNISNLYQTFSMLGISDSLIPDFAKQLLAYLKNQGAGTELLNALATAWAS